VLWLTGDGGWEVHAAADYQFDVPVPARSGAQAAQTAPQSHASVLVD